MLVHAFLIKYAEIALKGKNRYRFEDALVHQMEIALSKIEGDFEVKKEQGRVYVFCPENYDYDEAVDALQPDLIVLAGFLVVIPPEMIAKYRNRMINIHPSLIPSFCGKGFYGLKVHEAALERGVKVVGATVHFVDTGTDTGPIILQKAVEVQQGDTPEVLQRRVMEEAEWKILPKAIDLIANNRVSVQNGKVVID